MSKEAEKFAYFFQPGAAEGRTDLRWLLGGKGANLAEMSNVGLPVPPGFTITTEACRRYQDTQEWPKGLEAQVARELKKLEKVTGRKLGDEHNPLLVSVRSGGAVSMPGMMDTVLNLGLNDDAVQGLAEQSGDARFAWDCYRRFIQMFGSVAMNIPHADFDGFLHRARAKAGVKFDSQLSAADLKGIVAEFKKIYKKDAGEAFPQEPMAQLRRSINAVFGSWNNPQAVRYREINEIRGLVGTAVNVQTPMPNWTPGRPGSFTRRCTSSCSRSSRRLSRTMPTCRTSSSPASRARSTCCRRAPASARPRLRCASPSRWPGRGS